jgi:hypothetical protein
MTIRNHPDSESLSRRMLCVFACLALSGCVTNNLSAQNAQVTPWRYRADPPARRNARAGHDTDSQTGSRQNHYIQQNDDRWRNPPARQPPVTRQGLHPTRPGGRQTDNTASKQHDPYRERVGLPELRARRRALSLQNQKEPGNPDIVPVGARLFRAGHRGRADFLP